VFFSALLCCLSRFDALAQPVVEQNILLLYAYGYGGRGVELFSDGFFKAITEAGFPVSSVYAEYLDLQRNKDLPNYRQDLLDVLRKKYSHHRIDLIVTVQQPALDFLLNEGKILAPQAPVITIQHRSLLETEKVGRRIVGEINHFDIKGTLERALELFPKTKRVVFASGSSEADKKVVDQASGIAESFQKQLEFEYTTGMTLEEILERVAHLPPHSIVIFTQYNIDTKGRVALAYEAENMIVKFANAPVFGFYDYNLRNGGIGGSVIDVQSSGVRTGHTAIDILKGVDSVSPGQLRENENVPMFDWQQIERWGGDIDRLPTNTVFINRPPSLWKQYGLAIVGTLVFMLIQSVLIVRLLINIRRRKRAEAKIHQLNAELEQRVSKRTVQLEAANKELEAFCYSVSHDLRAPLRHIDGYVDLLVSRCRDGLSEKGLHYVATIADSARQMGKLIDDLLQFSRTGRAEMSPTLLDMHKILEEARVILEESYAGRTIEWNIGKLPSVSGDYPLLRQVWVNLLGNALKYTGTREVARITVSARDDNGEIIFVVSDNGVGFEMQYVDKLFGVFQRLHRTEEFEGTGIGLATVHRIIARHGGRVWAEAEPNQGAKFFFTLPK
jgi:signal transduction histidine kinase